MTIQRWSKLLTSSVCARCILDRRLQYTPVFHGFFGWQLYSGKGYTAAAELPLNRWVHVKLVASGYSARLFIDGAQEPQLTMTSLKRPWARGMVGLWGQFGGANFANVVVSPADTTAPSSRPADTPPSPQILSTWELSGAFETATTKPDALGDISYDIWSARADARDGNPPDTQGAFRRMSRRDVVFDQRSTATLSNPSGCRQMTPWQQSLNLSHAANRSAYAA